MATLHPIKAFRERQFPSMSQEALAQKLGVDRVTVARWEAGRRPDRELLRKIVKVTGIPASELRPDLAEMVALFSEGNE